MADNYVPQVDYTSRDYEAIREDLIALIPNFAPKWTNRDPADFGMTMIDNNGLLIIFFFLVEMKQISC
jgi:hypothetical protein